MVHVSLNYWPSLVTQTVKKIHLQCRRPGFAPWVWKILWRRAWQPTPVFLPGESPWTEEPRGLQSMGLQRLEHDWARMGNTTPEAHWGFLSESHSLTLPSLGCSLQYLGIVYVKRQLRKINLPMLISFHFTFHPSIHPSSIQVLTRAYYDVSTLPGAGM